MKQLKRNYLIVVLLLLSMVFSENAASQITEAEYAKYWYYRHRLRTEFMVMGKGPECIDGRGSDYGGNLGYSIPAHQIYTNSKDIKWADGTIDLGFYIAVLATEYKLLLEEGHDTQKTLHELYLAVKAYERLDNFSYNRIDGSQDCRNDGYFIRDDIHEDIFPNNPVFEKYKDASGSYNYRSDYVGSYGDDAGGVKTVTPDQLHSLLLGFAMVKKCLGDVSYNGFNFKEKVVEYAVATANYLEDRNWVVKDENDNENKFSRVFRQEGHAWITAKAVGYLSDPHTSGDFLNEVTPITRGLIKASIGVQVDIWPLLKDFTIAHMAAGFAVGDPGSSHKGFETDGFLKSIRKSNNWRRLGLEGTYPDYDIYYLIYNFLRDRNEDLTDSHNIEQQLKNAPCYGTRYRQFGMDESHPYYYGEAGWRASNKWFRGYNRNGNERDKNVTHGLDYMLAYNVFMLYYKDKIPLKVGNLPAMSPGGFSINIDDPTSLSHNLYAFNDLTISSDITTTSNVEMLSKKTVLEPGFRYVAGSSSLRLVGGPRNACGDILDDYGDLKQLDSETIFPGSAQRFANAEVNIDPAIEEEQTTEADQNSFKRKRNYKSIDQFLEENSHISVQSTDRMDRQEVFVYPNPATTELNISIPDSKNSCIIELVSLDGKTLQRKEYPADTSKVKLNIYQSDYTGVLLVKIITGQSVTIKKIIIE